MKSISWSRNDDASARDRLFASRSHAVSPAGHEAVGDAESGREAAEEAAAAAGEDPRRAARPVRRAREIAPRRLGAVSKILRARRVRPRFLYQTSP